LISPDIEVKGMISVSQTAVRLAGVNSPVNISDSRRNFFN
jgi:hypothetical protein